MIPSLLQRLRELGVRMMTETVLRQWHGNGPTVQVFGGNAERNSADRRVMATTNVSERGLSDELGAAAVGDAVAARTAAKAIYEGRKLALEL